MAFPISPIKTNAIKSASCQIIHPKFSPSSLNNVAVLGDGHGNQLMRKSYARSRSDMHPPNRVGNRSKHIYAKNILTKHQSPMQGVGKRITDVTKGGTKDHVENLLRHSPQSSSSPALIQQPVQKSVRQELFGKGKFAYSSDNYYNANTLKRRDSFEKSCYHNIASREPRRAFFKHDYAASEHSNIQKRGLRNFDKLGFGESYVSKYDRRYELTCEDVVFMKNVDRSSEYPKKKRWSPKDEGKKFYLPHNAVCTQYFTFRTNPTLALQLD